jgi:transketolase
MTTLPNMTVVAPGDPGEIRQLLPQLFALGGPAYFTVGRFGEPSYEALEPAVLGKARALRRGERISIISTGELANEVLRAVELLKDEAVYPSAYQMHTVKPLDTALLDRLAKQGDSIIIVEEHLPNGGLWSAVCQWRASVHAPVDLHRLGPPDLFALGNLQQAELRRRFGFDAGYIALKCSELWNKL